MMDIPFFYIPHFKESENNFILEEDTSRHIVQVLRMKAGDKLNLTDGKGNLLHCEITDDHKKHCAVKVINKSETPQPGRKITIAISLLKNSSRFEWFVEKATEICVTEIVPLICHRTEKQKFRRERIEGICISAMLQSKQCWLPGLREPVKFENIKDWNHGGTTYIAHCSNEPRQVLSPSSSNSLICIGPEGDFTNEEVQLALQHNFIPVSLGETRLRSETAGIVAAALLALRQAQDNAGID
jgi:16S rRNA (uracil1498-N3)-methyltransferase